MKFIWLFMKFFLVNTILPAWITKIPHFRSLMSFTQPLYKFPWSLLFPIKKIYWHLSLFYSFVFLPLLGNGKNKLTSALFDSCRVIPTRLYKNYFWLCYMFNSLFFSFFSIWIKRLLPAVDYRCYSIIFDHTTAKKSWKQRKSWEKLQKGFESQMNLIVFKIALTPIDSEYA